MFAIQSIPEDNSFESESLIKAVNGKVVSCLFNSTNHSNFEIASIFNSPTEEDLDSFVRLLGEFSIHIKDNLQSDQVKKNIIDFSGKISGSENILVMLHGSFMSNMSLTEYYQLCENIKDYLKKIESFIYTNISSSCDVPDVPDVFEASEVSESDEYDSKDPIAIQSKFLDTDKGIKRKQRTKEQPSKKLKKRKEFLRRQVKN